MRNKYISTHNPIIEKLLKGRLPLMGHYSLLCYSLEEVLIEKLRFVIQRMTARDFYDIWHLLVVHRMEEFGKRSTKALKK